MKQVCLLCGRISAGGDLFCQETYCPGEMSRTILSAGDWFGDIEIVKPIIVLRSAVLYEATHQKTRIYLKVAHPGAENKERLKREAEFLQALQLRKLQQQTLPQLLPAYANTTVAVDAYGKTMLGGHLLYFYLFEHFEGEPLRDVLRRNPQLWVSHVGWLMISLAATVNYLHMQGRYHFGLSPDSLLVRFDEKPNVPRILLFDLGVVTDKAHLKQDWYDFAVPPAYTAPELIDTEPGQLAGRLSHRCVWPRDGAVRVVGGATGGPVQAARGQRGAPRRHPRAARPHESHRRRAHHGADCLAGDRPRARRTSENCL